LRLALLANGIDCDSSVYAGGFSAERGYDYRNAFSAHQPYFAAAEDPQLNAPPAEEDLLELPIFTFRPGERWFLDGPEGPRAGQRLRGFLRARLAREHSPEAMRALARVRGVAAALYHVARPLRPLLSRFLPRRLLWQAGSEYPPAPGPAHDYFVMVGHTKADLDLDGIRQTLDVLRLDGVEFLRLSELAALAREELAPQGRPDARAEMEYQVRREYDAVMSDERNLAQSARLQSMIPLDRERVLDLGCGAGDWTRRIARLRPWAHVVGIDAGVPFVTRAAARRAGERSAFAAADFARLPFSSAAFDCVYADTTLEHAFDVDRTLAEAWRVLRDGGVLVATIPSDGRNPARACDNHTWKTVPADVRARLHHAGFVDVCLEEVDILRKLAMPPYAPADDRMMFVRAWKRAAPATQLERAREAMAWVYRRIQPGAPPVLATRAEEFLAAGNALCWGYSVVLGEFLRAEGYTVRWVTMIAEGHPRGRGPRRLDSHEVLEVTADGRRLVLDPTCNTVIPWSVEELLAEPWRATAKADPDDRYLDGQYQLYDSVEWYRRVRRYAVRRDPAQPLWPWSWRRLRALPGPAARAEAGR
jgi:SAM-dependent methyltransferase